MLKTLTGEEFLSGQEVSDWMKASDADIKKVYREKCLQFHPDKLASKGLPDEFMKFANDQLVKINEAYETIKDARVR